MNFILRFLFGIKTQEEIDFDATPTPVEEPKTSSWKLNLFKDCSTCNGYEMGRDYDGLPNIPECNGGQGCVRKSRK